VIKQIIHESLPYYSPLPSDDEVMNAQANLDLVRRISVEFVGGFDSKDICPSLNSVSLKTIIGKIIQNAYDSIYISGKSAGVEIIMEAKKENEFIKINIFDNGIGFEDLESDISMLRSTFANRQVPFGGRGTALSSVVEELAPIGGSISRANRQGLAGAIITILIPER